MSAKILQSIAEQSQPAKAKGAWSFLPPVPSVRRLPADKATLEQELRDKFPTEKLKTMRVLVPGPDDLLRLNPVLADPSTFGLFLQRTKGESSCDIVNQYGSLASPDPPAIHCENDESTKHIGDKMKTVFVACSDEDLVVLKALGLPVTTAAGLSTMSGDQLSRLFAGISGAPGSKTAGSVGVLGASRLVLGAWSLSELTDQLPGELAAIVQCLLRAEDAYGFETSPRLEIWRPTAQEVDGIRAAAKFRDRALAHKLILKSVGTSTRSVREFCEADAARQPVDYDVARRELLRTLEETRELGFQQPVVARQLVAFRRAFERSIVEAILLDAKAADFSIDRALLVAAAELMGYWHSATPLVRMTENAVGGGGQPHEAAIHPTQCEEQLQIVNQLIKIHQTMTRD